MSDAANAFRLRRHTQTLLAILVVSTLVGAGTAVNAGWHAWHDPHAFLTNDFSTADMAGKIRPDQPLNVGMSYVRERPATLRVDSARPRVLLNTAGADITVSVCRVDPSRADASIGSVYGDLSKWCREVVDPAGARMQLRDAAVSDQLILTIRPTRPGVVMVWGLDVTYGYGHRHGTQHVGANVRFKVPGQAQ
ncbi:MAG: hypothetical protein WAK18_06570 [Nocardioidaceae bacterium]